MLLQPDLPVYVQNVRPDTNNTSCIPSLVDDRHGTHSRSSSGLIVLPTRRQLGHRPDTVGDMAELKPYGSTSSYENLSPQVIARVGREIGELVKRPPTGK